MAFRPTFLKVHRWVGLVVAALLIVQGLTGGAIVYRDRLNYLYPAMTVPTTAARLPVQQLLDVVHAAHPDDKVTRINFPDESDRAMLFWLEAKKGGALSFVAVDPFRGKIVRDGGLTHWPAEFLFRVHEEWLSGDTGKQVIGIEGAALLFMAITGPIVWWPGVRRLRQGLKVRWQTSADMRWRTLHRSAGAIIASVLIISATTGMMMIWKPQLRALIAGVTPVADKPSPKVAKDKAAKLLPVDVLIAKARADYGPTRLDQLRFPGGSGRVVVVYLATDLSNRPDASKQIWFNAYTGVDVGHYVTGALPAGSEFVDWIYTVHTAAFLGWPGRVALSLVGLSLAGLSASGLWLWWSRNARRARAKSSSRGHVLAK